MTTEAAVRVEVKFTQADLDSIKAEGRAANINLDGYDGVEGLTAKQFRKHTNVARWLRSFYQEVRGNKGRFKEAEAIICKHGELAADYAINRNKRFKRFERRSRKQILKGASPASLPGVARYAAHFGITS